MYSVNDMTGYLYAIDERGNKFLVKLDKIRSLELTEDSNYAYSRNGVPVHRMVNRTIEMSADIKAVSLIKKEDPDFSGIEELL